MVRRAIVGAHYGWMDFLAQRITAVVMVVYTLLVLAIALYHGGIDYARWQALFTHTAFRITTLLFALALLWHAWIGMRDIWMDYIKPTALRLTLEVLTVIALMANAGWVVLILWGRTG
jgi:succinate dehydrogenase / fumarate reductase, membrane anchor subunit